MERGGKKLLGPRAVAAVSDIEGGPVAATTLPETGNARPSYDDGVGMRGERGVGIGIGGKRERKRSYCRPKNKRKNK